MLAYQLGKLDGRMFHFKRRTLWIIIYLTIPLVFVLNQIGPEEEFPKTSVETEAWSLDGLALQCEANLCELFLQNTPQYYVSAIMDRIPASAVNVPEGVVMTTHRQGGLFVVTLAADRNTTSVKQINRFLKGLIPQSASLRWVYSGPPLESQTAVWALDQSEFDGREIALTEVELAGLGRLKSPPVGTQDQLAFLMWIEILKQRLAGYSVSVTWNHQTEFSWVLFNSTLSSDLFYPATDEELKPIIEAYASAADKRDRTLVQIHRYAVTASIYQLPFEFFRTQPERLQAIDLPAIERMREYSLEQIKN